MVAKAAEPPLRIYNAKVLRLKTSAGLDTVESALIHECHVQLARSGGDRANR